MAEIVAIIKTIGSCLKIRIVLEMSQMAATNLSLRMIQRFMNKSLRITAGHFVTKMLSSAINPKIMRHQRSSVGLKTERNLKIVAVHLTVTSRRIAMVLEMTRSIAGIPSYSISLKIATIPKMTGIHRFTANLKMMRTRRSSVGLMTETSWRVATVHLTVTSRKIAMVLEMTRLIAGIQSYSISLKIATIPKMTGIHRFTASLKMMQTRGSSVGLMTETSRRVATVHLTVTSRKIAMMLEVNQWKAGIPSYSMSLKIATVLTVTGILRFAASPRIMRLQRSSVSLKTERNLKVAAVRLTQKSQMIVMVLEMSHWIAETQNYWMNFGVVIILTVTAIQNPNSIL